MIFLTEFLKMKHKLYVASGSAPPPQGKILGVPLVLPVLVCK